MILQCVKDTLPNFKPYVCGITEVTTDTTDRYWRPVTDGGVVGGGGNYTAEASVSKLDTFYPCYVD